MSDVNYQNLFEVLKQKEEANGKIIIILTPDLSIPTHDLMIRHRVKFDTAINFKALTEYGSDVAQKMGSSTQFYTLNNEDKAAVFIQNEFIPYGSDCNGNIMNEAYRYVFLMHELAHINDVENGINFDKETEEGDLVKAAVYAKVCTLKHLTLKKQTYARMLYAKTLLKVDDVKNEYSLKVQRELMKKYPKKKLMQWSKQSS